MGYLRDVSVFIVGSDRKSLKRVTSVKIALSPKVSLGVKLFTNMKRILTRVTENFPGGSEHLFS